MSTSIGTRTFALVLAVALACLALSWAPAVGVATGHELRPAEECGYSGCHDGAPAPGSEASETPAAVETTCVPGRPSVSGKLRIHKVVRVSGKLTPAPSVATTITIYYERKVGRHFRAWSHVNVPVSAGAPTYVARPRLPKRGAWRARGVHVEVSGARSSSGWRAFRVR